jgi:AraC family transcriptional regulator
MSMSNLDGATINQASRRLELPPVSVPSERGLLRGQETSLLYDECQSPAVVAEHDHQQLQIGLLFEPATYVLSWRMPSGEPLEQRLVGPQVYLVAPGQVHACRSETEIELLVLYVEESFWRRYVKRKMAGVSIAEAASGGNRDIVLWQLASTLRQLCNENGETDLRLVEIVGGALALRAIKLLCSAQPVPGVVGGILSPNRLRAVEEFIQKQLAYDIHVVDLAKQVGHSVPHFTVVFKNTTGMAPYEYITRCRMLKAHELLRTGEYRLGEVARAVGYEDQGHFSGRFREHFRYPPKFLMTQARGKSFKSRKKS